jgi:hypothetical protein
VEDNVLHRPPEGEMVLEVFPKVELKVKAVPSLSRFLLRARSFGRFSSLTGVSLFA